MMMMNTTNGTLMRGPPAFVTPRRDLYIGCTLYGLISFASIIGNGLVFAAFFKSSKIRNSRTNYFIVSLCCADILAGCFSIPLYTYLMSDNFKGYFNKDDFYYVYQFTDVFSTTASVWHLAFISLERYFAIVWPVLHHVATSTTYFVVMAALWVVSLLSGGLSIQFSKYREKYVIYNSAFLFGLPLAIIVFSYLSILRTTIRRSYVTSRTTFERELKVAFTIFILIALFIICWCPFFVISVLSPYCSCITITMVIYFKALHFATSCVNPVVYAARIPDFRTAFSKVLPKQIISLLFCLLHKPRRETPPSSRARTCSTLSSTIAMVDATKDSRRRPTLLENKAVADELLLKTPNEPSVMAGSVTSNKCVSFMSDSPSSTAGSHLAKV